jgi:hypothetical protein
VHSVLVIWCSRVAGLVQDAAPAVVLVLIGGVGAAGALWLVPWRAWAAELRRLPGG